jgi:hypothetical protein
MSDLMPLRHGPTVRESAALLALQLEARGFVMTAEHGTLKISNGSRLTQTDRADIAANKVHLVAICEYIASGVVDATP